MAEDAMERRHKNAAGISQAGEILALQAFGAAAVTKEGQRTDRRSEAPFFVLDHKGKTVVAEEGFEPPTQGL